MTPDYLHDVDAILGYLPNDYEALAEEHDVLRVQHGNAKIRTARDLMWLFFTHVGLNLPLRQTAAVAREANGPAVSPMQIHKKLIRSVSYLEALMQRMAWFDVGIRGAISFTVLYMSAAGSPTERPPSAKPSKGSAQSSSTWRLVG